MHLKLDVLTLPTAALPFCRGIVPLEAFGLLLTVHANGEIALCIRPAGEELEWGLAAGSPRGVGLLRPRRALIRAHRSPIVLAAQGGVGLVTVSGEGTIRWVG